MFLETKFIFRITIKSVFRKSELHLKFVYKLKGCNSDYVLMESYPIVILSESVLRENFKCSMKAPGMPIKYEESS